MKRDFLNITEEDMLVLLFQVSRVQMKRDHLDRTEQDSLFQNTASYAEIWTATKSEQQKRKMSFPQSLLQSKNMLARPHAMDLVRRTRAWVSSVARGNMHLPFMVRNCGRGHVEPVRFSPDTQRVNIVAASQAFLDRDQSCKHCTRWCISFHALRHANGFSFVLVRQRRSPGAGVPAYSCTSEIYHSESSRIIRIWIRDLFQTVDFKLSDYFQIWQKNILANYQIKLISMRFVSMPRERTLNSSNEVRQNPNSSNMFELRR